MRPAAFQSANTLSTRIFAGAARSQTSTRMPTTSEWAEKDRVFNRTVFVRYTSQDGIE
jgi:hypothetical protein